MEWTQFIQEARSWISPIPVKIGMTVLNFSDSRTWHEALIIQSLFVCEFTKNDALRNPAQMKQWLITIASLDVGVLGKQLKTIANEIRHYASSWSVFDYNTFKEYCGCSFLGMFFSPIKDYLVSFLEDPIADTLRVLLQWGCFLTRITLDSAFSPSFAEFISVEDRLKALEPDGWWVKLRDVLLPIALRYQPEVESFHPHFSDGASANVPKALGIWGKTRLAFHFTDQQRYLLWKCGWNTMDLPVEDRSPLCRLVFVPKGIDSQRLICEEPASNMFLQQGVKDDIYSWLKYDHELSRHIDLEDQTKQRDWACQASKSLSYATLDLSSASDSVSWSLVEYVFAGTELLEELRLTRTEEVSDFHGFSTKLSKFAPMGSALCFPTECLIFYGICKLACITSGVAADVGVYGDDLIVPRVCEDLVIELLTHFGFTVNEKKSFFGYERFKESCGGEYFDGISVAPLYIPRKFSFPSDDSHDYFRLHPENQPMLVDFVNTLFNRGFHESRKFLLLSYVLPCFPGVRFADNCVQGIYSPVATNFHLKTRWNKVLQRLEFRVAVLRNVGEIIVDDDVRYLLTLIALSRTTRDRLLFPEDSLNVVLSTQLQSLVWVWEGSNSDLEDAYWSPLMG